MQNESTELKEWLKILGLTYIGAQIRAFNIFQRINNQYIYQRNWVYRTKRALRECYANGVMLIYWRDQVIKKYEK